MSEARARVSLRPQRDLNPRYWRERALEGSQASENSCTGPFGADPLGGRQIVDARDCEAIVANSPAKLAWSTRALLALGDLAGIVAADRSVAEALLASMGANP
jgi:hypothetical protein